MNWYKQFSFPWIAVTDFQASLKFYRDDLEFELVNVDENETWAQFKLDSGKEIAIHKVNMINANPNGALVFEVDNINQTELWLRGKGINLQDKKMVSDRIKIGLFTDPDDNMIQITEKIESE